MTLGRSIIYCLIYLSRHMTLLSPSLILIRTGGVYGTNEGSDKFYPRPLLGPLGLFNKVPKVVSWIQILTAHTK